MTDSKLNLGGYLRIGDVAPNFDADSSLGQLNWYEYTKGHWSVLMSHPRDFTPVCTTEIARVAQLDQAGEWNKRGVKVAIVSVDSAEEHRKWIKDINEYGKTKVEFPIFDDEDKKISMLYGMLDQTHLNDKGMPLTVRAVFVIDPDHKVRLIITYPASTGRNFNEIIRVIDSLQLASKSVATPADWSKGDNVFVIPSVSDDDAAKMFGEENVKPVLPSCKIRTVPDPSKSE